MVDLLQKRNIESPGSKKLLMTRKIQPTRYVVNYSIGGNDSIALVGVENVPPFHV